MRKSLYSLMLIAAAAISLVGCKEDIPESIAETSHKVKIVADREFTKTTYNIDEPTNAVIYSWSTGDEEIWTLSEETPSPAKFFVFENGEPATGICAYLDNDLMTIEADFAGEPVSGATYSGYFNSKVASEQLFYEDDGTLVYDQDSDVMVAAETTAAEDGTIQFCFKRLVSFAQLNLLNIEGEEVTEVKLISNNSNFAGDFNFEDQSFVNLEQGITITTESPIESDVTGSGATVVAVLLPTETQGFSITVTTADATGAPHTYTKDITKTITFTRGNVKGLNINFTGCEVVPEPAKFVKITSAPEDWSGQYLIVFEGATISDSEVTPKAFNGSLATLDAINNCIDVTISNNSIELNDETSNAFFDIERSDNQYTITSSSGFSIGNELDNKGAAQNGLKTGDYTNTISISGNDGAVLISCASTDMKFNGASNQMRFRYYKSGQQNIYLYKYTGTEPLVPVEPTIYSISIDNTINGGSVSADAEQAIAGTTVKLTATADEGYEFVSWNVTNDTTSETITVENDEFEMPASDVNVSATFTEKGQSEDEEVASFIFNTDAGLSALGITKPSSGAGTNLGTKAYTSAAIIMTATNGGTATRVWNSNGSTTLRLYNNGGSLTFSGATITKIEFDDSCTSLTADCGSYQEGTWTGSATSVTFTAGGSVTIKTIDVTYTSGTAVTKYSISCNKVDGGTLSASPSSAEEDEIVTLTASPSTGYVFNNDWSVKDASNNTIAVTDSKFSMPASNVTVSGSFSKVNYNITKTAAQNGTYTVKKGDSEVSQAQYRDQITLNASPAEGYILDRWEVKDGNNENVSVSNNSFYMPASAVSVSAYFVAASAVPVYASLAELVAAGTPPTTATKVTVTLTNEEITSIYVTNKGYRNGIFLKSGNQDVEIFAYDVPEEWTAGGTVSGTLTECDWVLYNGSTWELKPANWSELTYTAPTSGGDGEEVTYTKITSLSDLTTGDYVIVGAQKAAELGELTYGTLNSGRIPYADKYTSAPASISKTGDDDSIWHVTVSGTSVTLYNTKNKNYIADAGSGKLKYAATGMSFTAACTEGVFSLASGSYYLCVNTSSDYWRNYAASTGYNSGVCLYFYKKN